MKNFFHYFCAIILVVFMGTFISSCSDDDNESNGGMHGKKLLQIDGTSFIYNDEGKLQDASSSSGKSHFTWSQNSIICEKEHGAGYTALLSNNKIIRLDGTDYIYEKNKLVQTKYESATITYTWTNGNVTNIHFSGWYNGYENYSISYYPDKKGNKAIENYIYGELYAMEFVWPIIAHPWLMGDGNKNLIKSISATDSYKKNSYVEFEYEFDKDGYPIGITNHDGSWSTNLIWGE